MMILTMAAVLAGAPPAPDLEARAPVERACLDAIAATFADARPSSVVYYVKTWKRGPVGWRLDYEAEVTDRLGRATGVTGRCDLAAPREIAERTGDR